MEKHQPSATESLLRIALGIDVVLIFFGTLVIRGLDRFDEVMVWSVGAGLFVVVIALFGLIRYPVGLWVGHAVHAAMLSGFAVDFAVGLSVAVPVGFWIFGMVKGRQLDAGRPSNPGPSE